MKIAIFGAAGGIGRAVLPELLARGHAVRIVGRDRAKLEAMARAGVEIATADLARPEDALRAANGVDAILYAVGVPYPRFDQHPVLMRITLAAAKAAGVRQLLHIATVYPYGRPQTPLVAETHPQEPHTVKGRYRKEQADLVLAAHDPAGLSTLALALPDFYGPTADLGYVKEIFDAAMTGRSASIVGPQHVPHEYVYLPDVAPVVADLFERPELFGRLYNFGGPATLTTREFVALAERASGTHIKTLAVNKTLLRFLGTVNPLMREIVEMYYLFTDSVVLDDSALRAALPRLHKTPYAAGIAATIAALRPGTVYAPS